MVGMAQVGFTLGGWGNLGSKIFFVGASCLKPPQPASTPRRSRKINKKTPLQPPKEKKYSLKSGCRCIQIRQWGGGPGIEKSTGWLQEFCSSLQNLKRLNLKPKMLSKMPQMPQTPQNVLNVRKFPSKFWTNIAFAKEHKWRHKMLAEKEKKWFLASWGHGPQSKNQKKCGFPSFFFG